MFRTVHGDASSTDKATRKVGGVYVREPVFEVPVWWLAIRRFFGFFGLLGHKAAKHPVLSGLVALAVWLRIALGSSAFGWLMVGVLVAMCAWAVLHWTSFERAIRFPAVSAWRRWFVYERRWHATMAVCGLAILYGDLEYVPTLRQVRSTRFIDRVIVDMVSGQVPEQWENQAPALAHTFGALSCRVRAVKPRRIALEFMHADPLAATVKPDRLDSDDEPHAADRMPVNLSALPLGVRADGEPWTLRLTTHVLVAGASEAGKGSVVWALLRALGPAIQAGYVAPWVLDPKGGMELSFGEPLFRRFEADSYEGMACMLEDAADLMDVRTRRLRGVARQHIPTPDEPLVLVVVDEMADLTAYCPDRAIRQRIASALSRLLSKGRAAAVHVVAALQDPRKDVLPFRDLFPIRICLRVTEASHVDMVLGDGARDRGATCDLIDPTLAGVGFVTVAGVREPVRVRATYHSDQDIAAMVERFKPRVHDEIPAQRSHDSDEMEVDTL
ncbi:S-DNA-T family DNA segregation ATPase FtsK/SpoIIIE [Catenulispora sp. MAP12-49]|uniref:FtsK/SpoIIIE domain-containing protein n=1 Tax=Catenulispora sp. MAP12-49 TaxID=3156302 RepID=UPI0035115BB0